MFGALKAIVPTRCVDDGFSQRGRIYSFYSID